jgi:lysophospholipase L1-like esterase
VQIVLLDYWNVTIDGAVAAHQLDTSERAEADRATRATNDAVAAAAAATHVRYVDTYAAFKGDDGRKDPTALLASDGDHPDQAGHEVIAQALIAALPAASL